MAPELAEEIRLVRTQKLEAAKALSEARASEARIMAQAQPKHVDPTQAAKHAKQARKWENAGNGDDDIEDMEDI